MVPMRIDRKRLLLRVAQGLQIDKTMTDRILPKPNLLHSRAISNELLRLQGK